MNRQINWQIDWVHDLMAGLNPDTIIFDEYEEPETVLEDIPEHDCWEHGRNTSHIMTIECTLCGAMFGRFGGD